MTRIPRSQLIPKNEPGCHHCYNRTMSNTTLCGIDPLTKIDHSNRRALILEGLQLLASGMLIEVIRVALMSNHYHLILRVRPSLVNDLSDREVLERIALVSPHTLLKHGQTPTAKLLESRIKQLVNDVKFVEKMRERLKSISWFIRLFQQMIARQCKIDSDHEGHVFTGRFKSKQLTSPAALLACAIYIDLNPIRAGAAESPEESIGTSVHLQILGRLQRARRAIAAGARLPEDGDLWLDTAFGSKEDPDAWLAPITLDPEHRLHHQLNGWKAKGQWRGRKRDLTGGDPALTELLRKLEAFQWLVTGKKPANRNRSSPSDLPPPGEGNRNPDRSSTDEHLPEQDLQEITKQFESLLVTWSADDDRYEDSPDEPADERSASDPDERDVDPANELARAASHAARERRKRRRRRLIATCRRQLNRLIDVSDIELINPLAGCRSKLTKRLARLVKRCHSQSPIEMLECGNRTNAFPSRRASNKGFLPVTSEEYLVILEATGRMIRADKPGWIPKELPPILQRLGLRSSGWLGLFEKFEDRFPAVVGGVDEVRKWSEQRHCKTVHGLQAAREAFL